MSGARVRLATIDDESSILALQSSYYREDGYPHDAERVRPALRTLLVRRDHGCVLVVEERAHIVGYVVVALSYSLEYLGVDAFVDELYVAPARRGDGLGARALDAAVDAARDLGAHALHMEVELDKLDTIAFYERRGFVRKTRAAMTRWLVEAPEDGS